MVLLAGDYIIYRSNADALKAFVAATYQNPKLVEIIDLIVRVASHG